MVSWIKCTIVLCLYGFFKELKPSESFLTPFLNSTFKNINKEVISDEIYPVYTYSYSVFLLLVFLFTDAIGYKVIINIEALAYLVTRVLLCWADGIHMMQFMQVSYGLASATEIAYFTYIYAAVNEARYHKVTSYVRMAVLLGKGFADLFGQVLISTHVTSYLVLNYISFTSVCIAVIIAIFLPGASRITYEKFENVCNEEIEKKSDVECYTSVKSSIKFRLLFFKDSYKNNEVFIWSVYWAFASCGGLQVENYVMNLWSDIDKDTVYNGAVFSFGTMLSALLVFFFSCFKNVEWDTFIGEVIIAFVSLIDCILLVLMASTEDIWVAYACYAGFRASFALILTIASFQIARHLKKNGYAMIFGFNTFTALLLQSLLTFIVADKKGLDLNLSNQFTVYGAYFGMITVCFMVRPCIKLVRRCLASPANVI